MIYLDKLKKEYIEFTKKKNFKEKVFSPFFLKFFALLIILYTFAFLPSYLKETSSSGFTGIQCKFTIKKDYWQLNYTNCNYRCDNMVDGVNVRMANGDYAWYKNKKIILGTSCPRHP